MIVEPMTDAELDGLRSKIFAYNRKERSRLRLFGQNVIRILARLDAERTRADAAEAERDAAVARAMPEWRWRPIESAPHNELVLLYCPDRGPTNRERIELGYASHGSRSAISSSLSQHAWATMWRPLPDLPTPTAAQEGQGNG